MAGTPEGIFERLLNAEITHPEMKKSECMIIVLMHFIQNRPVEGRLALVRALERYKNDDVFSLLKKTADSLVEQDLEAALSELHDIHLVPALEPYLIELKSRVLVRRLYQILCAYSSISIKELSKALGFAEQEAKVQEFLPQIQWPLCEDGFVEPKDTEAYRQFVQSSFNWQFGPEFESNPKSSEPSKYNGLSMETLQNLMEYAELLDQQVELPDKITTTFWNPMPYEFRR